MIVFITKEYKCHIISLIRDGWYIDFPNYIKTKKATINATKITSYCDMAPTS